MSMSIDPASSRFVHCEAKPDLFVDALFPLQSIFDDSDFRLDTLFEAFLRDNSQHFNTNAAPNWIKCDILKKLGEPGQEEAIAGFFRSVAQFTSEFQLNKRSPQTFRIWSAGNKDRPARSGDVIRKPDIVGVDPAVGVSDDWRHFQVLGEIKGVELADCQVYKLLYERAATMFRHQDSRRFVLVFALLKHQMTIAFFDRGGSVFSKIDVMKQPLLFFQCILGLSFGPDEFIGYDTTVLASANRLINSKTLRLVIVYCTLFLADRMEGRGTVVWLGRLLLEAESRNVLSDLFLSQISQPSLPSRIAIPIVIKDTWVDEKNSITEGILIALLNHKGVKGVPHVVSEEAVPAPLPPSWPKDKDYPTDSTTVNRSRLKLPTDAMRLNDAARKKAQETPGVLGYAPRAHIRQYTTPYTVPIFEFRSGVELLGTIFDVLTSHEQATSDYYVDPQDVVSGDRKPFPFRFLHRDPSSRNMGMVPNTLSDHVSCPFRKNGEHRGLLYDWGFTAIADVNADSRGADNISKVDEPDSEAEVITEEGFVLLPREEEADCGLSTATPQLIDDFDSLVNIVRDCMAHERPGLEITMSTIGTLPYMSVELLDASLCWDRGQEQDDDESTVPVHSVRHDLEGFYMVLVSLCLLFERPHQPKDFRAYAESQSPLLQSNRVLPEAIVAWLTNQSPLNEYTLRDRFITFGTSMGLRTKILPCLSSYFRPMGPYLERIRELIYGNHEWCDGRYKCPPTSPTHYKFRSILLSAMQEIPTSGDGSFSKLVAPPQGFYPPIRPDGTWSGGIFDRKNPIIRPNNAFGYFEPGSIPIVEKSEPVTSPSLDDWDRIPTPKTTQATSPTYKFVNRGPESFCQHRNLRRTHPSSLYPLVPSVQGTSTNKPRKKVCRTLKPFSANSGGTRLLAVKLRKRRDQYQKGRNLAGV